MYFCNISPLFHNNVFAVAVNWYFHVTGAYWSPEAISFAQLGRLLGQAGLVDKRLEKWTIGENSGKSLGGGRNEDLVDQVDDAVGRHRHLDDQLCPLHHHLARLGAGKEEKRREKVVCLRPSLHDPRTDHIGQHVVPDSNIYHLFKDFQQLTQPDNLPRAIFALLQHSLECWLESLHHGLVGQGEHGELALALQFL